MKAQMQKGFTLIELMIVVAITGILAAVAIPTYQNYTQRAQMSEALTMTAALKTAISEYAQINGVYPSTTKLQDLGLDRIQGTYGSAEVGGSGVITVTMGAAGTVGADIATKTLTIAPPKLTDLKGAFTWTCKSTTIEQKFLPKGCTKG